MGAPNSSSEPNPHRRFLCRPYKLARRRRSGRARGLSGRSGGQPGGMFFFFSNRLGCLGSIIISLLITGILLVLLGVL